MARAEGPGCPRGCRPTFQKRIYHRTSETGKQLFHPYGWMCFNDGVIVFDEDVEEIYLPFPERQRRKQR